MSEDLNEEKHPVMGKTEEKYLRQKEIAGAKAQG